MKICKVIGCTAISCGLGFCNKHYLRFKKYGDPSITKYQEFCNQPGCNNKHSRWGLCDKHAMRVEKNGVPDLLPRSKICNEPNCSEDAFRNKKCNLHWNEQFGSRSKCDLCLKTFVRPKHKQNERDKLGSGLSFCSISCRNDYADEFGMSPKTNLEWCSWCHRPYTKSKSLGIVTKLPFCSLKCMRVYQTNVGWYKAHNKDDPLPPEQKQQCIENLAKWRKLHEPCRSESVQKCLIPSSKCSKGRVHYQKTRLKLRKARGDRIYTVKNMVNTSIERKIFSMLAVNQIPFIGGAEEIWNDNKQKWKTKLKQKKFEMKEARSHKVDAFIEPNIVLEADGWAHELYQHVRDCDVNENLIEQNQKIFRFTEEMIHQNPQEVFHKILIAIKEHAPKLFEQKNLSKVLTFNFEKYGYPI